MWKKGDEVWTARLGMGGELLVANNEVDIAGVIQLRVKHLKAAFDWKRHFPSESPQLHRSASEAVAVLRIQCAEQVQAAQERLALVDQWIVAQTPTTKDEPVAAAAAAAVEDVVVGVDLAAGEDYTVQGKPGH